MHIRQSLHLQVRGPANNSYPQHTPWDCRKDKAPACYSIILRPYENRVSSLYPKIEFLPSISLKRLTASESLWEKVPPTVIIRSASLSISSLITSSLKGKLLTITSPPSLVMRAFNNGPLLSNICQYEDGLKNLPHLKLNLILPL